MVGECSYTCEQCASTALRQLDGVLFCFTTGACTSDNPNRDPQVQQRAQCLFWSSRSRISVWISLPMLPGYSQSSSADPEPRTLKNRCLQLREPRAQPQVARNTKPQMQGCELGPGVWTEWLCKGLSSKHRSSWHVASRSFFNE